MPPAQPLRWTALGAMALALPMTQAAPVQTRYRIDQFLSQEVDGTAAGQGKQSLSFNTSSFVTVTATDSAGGKALRVVVDSMRGDSTTPIPTAVFDSARGAVYHGFIAREGRPSRLELMSGGPPAAAQVQGLLSDFYPWVRAGLRPGESWADTTVTRTGDGADSVTVRRVTSYRAGGPEPKRKAVRVATEYTSEIAGTQPTPNGPAKLEGTGSGKGSYLVSSDGRYLGGEWELSSALKLSADFTPQPVPIALRQTTRVSTIE